MQIPSLHQAVFHFYSIEFFQHGLCGKEEEDDRCPAVDEVHGEARDVIGHQHFPVEGLGVIHQRRRRIHNAAVDDYRSKCPEGSETAATAAQEPLAEQHPRQKADDTHGEHLPRGPRPLGEQHIGHQHGDRNNRNRRGPTRTTVPLCANSLFCSTFFHVFVNIKNCFTMVKYERIWQFLDNSFAAFEGIV